MHTRDASLGIDTWKRAGRFRKFRSNGEWLLATGSWHDKLRKNK